MKARAVNSSAKWVRFVSQIDVTKSGGYIYQGESYSRDKDMRPGLYLIAVDRDTYHFVTVDKNMKLDYDGGPVTRGLWSNKSWAFQLAEGTGTPTISGDGSEQAEVEVDFEADTVEVEFEELPAKRPVEKKPSAPKDWEEHGSVISSSASHFTIRVDRNIKLDEFIALIPKELREEWALEHDTLAGYLKRNKVLQINGLDIL